MRLNAAYPMTALLAGIIACQGIGFVAFSSTSKPNTSAVALVGGGSNPHPGEISLAHNGVLFLDELKKKTCAISCIYQKKVVSLHKIS